MKRSGSVGDILYNNAIEREIKMLEKRERVDSERRVVPKTKFSTEKTEKEFGKKLSKELNEACMNQSVDHSDEINGIEFETYLKIMSELGYLRSDQKEG
jgi:hypothetical protein